MADKDHLKEDFSNLKSLMANEFESIKCFFFFNDKDTMKTYKVFTREVSSRDETRPRMKSSLSMVRYILLFTRFCRDEISSRNQLISV